MAPPITLARRHFHMILSVTYRLWLDAGRDKHLLYRGEDED
jgi:hypothetical protein